MKPPSVPAPGGPGEVLDIDSGEREGTPEDGAAFELRSTVVAAALHGQRLDRVLVVLAPEFSRSHLQSLIERGHVRVGAKVAVKSAQRVVAGQRVDVELVPTDESLAFVPQAMALDILHEDDDLLVLNKPAGLVVHPAPGHWSGTLLNGLLARHPGAASLPRAGIVHRLDKDTSGVMMVGKTLESVTALVRDLAARDVHRKYLALSSPPPPQDAFRVDQPIGRDPASRLRMAVHAGGRPSMTDFRVVARQEVTAALQCVLHTGRTHQIRVHAAFAGTPLVSDALYGGRPGWGLQRQALHALRLELLHPRHRGPMRFEAPLPEDLLQAWVAVTGRAPGWIDP